MKKMQFAIVLLVLFTSISFAGLDPIILDSYESSVSVDGQSSLLVIGGGAAKIAAYHASYVEVRATDPLNQGIGGIYTLDLYENSTLNYLGGETGAIVLRKNSTAVLQGGSINYLASSQDSDLKKHITFICDVDSVELNGNLLTGNWLGDRGSFSIILEDQDGFDRVYSNINFIPEPMSLALLGLGGLMLRKLKNS